LDFIIDPSNYCIAPEAYSLITVDKAWRQIKGYHRLIADLKLAPIFGFDEGPSQTYIFSDALSLVIAFGVKYFRRKVTLYANIFSALTRRHQTPVLSRGRKWVL
jgi:hypothetical protein